MPKRASEVNESAINELVSHVLALRKDFVQELLKGTTSSTERRQRKVELRNLLREQILAGEISVESVARFLDSKERGGKQHVFLMRPPAT